MRSCWRRAARPEQSIAVSRSDLGSSSFVLAGVLDAGRSGSWAGVRRPRGSIDSRREPRICGRGGTATADPVSCSVRPSPRERRDRCSGQAPHILPPPPLLATLPSPSSPPPCQTLPPPKLSWEMSPPLPRGGQGRGEPLCATAPWGMPYWPLGWQLLAPLRRAAARPLTVGAPTQIHSFRHQATAIKASARDRVHEENQPTGRTERVARPPTDGKLRTRTPRRSRHGQAVLPPPPRPPPLVVCAGVPGVSVSEARRWWGGYFQPLALPIPTPPTRNGGTTRTHLSRPAPLGRVSAAPLLRERKEILHSWPRTRGARRHRFSTARKTPDAHQA